MIIAKKRTFEELFPDAPKRPIDEPRTKRHQEYLDKLKSKHIIYLKHKTIFKDLPGFLEEVLQQYHNVYVKISNKDPEFVLKITSLMDSNIDRENKWNEYKNIIDNEIKNWNKKYAYNPNKQIGEIK